MKQALEFRRDLISDRFPGCQASGWPRVETASSRLQATGYRFYSEKSAVFAARGSCGSRGVAPNLRSERGGTATACMYE